MAQKRRNCFLGNFGEGLLCEGGLSGDSVVDLRGLVIEVFFEWDLMRGLKKIVC